MLTIQLSLWLVAYLRPLLHPSGTSTKSPSHLHSPNKSHFCAKIGGSAVRSPFGQPHSANNETVEDDVLFSNDTPVSLLNNTSSSFVHQA